MGAGDIVPAVTVRSTCALMRSASSSLAVVIVALVLTAPDVPVNGGLVAVLKITSAARAFPAIIDKENNAMLASAICRNLFFVMGTLGNF